MTPTISTDIDDTAALALKLRRAGLRPTRQRLALGQLIFSGNDRHLSAEELHEEALDAKVPVSLATVYNTLHQFTGAGLLRILSIDSGRICFDTNLSDHHHYFLEGENAVFDIPVDGVSVDNLPAPPEGMEIAHVDVIVRLRRKA